MNILIQEANMFRGERYSNHSRSFRNPLVTEIDDLCANMKANFGSFKGH